MDYQGSWSMVTGQWSLVTGQWWLVFWTMDTGTTLEESNIGRILAPSRPPPIGGGVDTPHP